MGYEQQNFIFHCLGAWKFRAQVPAWSGSGEDSPLFANCQLVASTHSRERVRQLSGIPLKKKGINPIHEGFTLNARLPPEGPPS